VPFAFLGGKQSAELGLNPEHLKEILRHRYAAEPLRLATTAQQIVADAVKGEVGGQVGKGPIAFAEVEQMTDLGGLAREAAGVVVGDPDQPFGLVKRQRAKQQGIDDAEYRGAGADAESHDENGEGGESRVAAQRSKRVAQVLQDAV